MGEIRGNEYSITISDEYIVQACKQSEKITYSWKSNTIFRYLRLPLMSNAFFPKFVYEMTRVFLTYLAIYLLLYLYTAAPPLSFEAFIEIELLICTIRRRLNVYINCHRVRLFCVSILVANIRSDTTNTQTYDFYWLIHENVVFIFVNFVLIEMREKLHSQRETLISLPK